MRVYYNNGKEHIEADVTPKMLRQMKDWDKRGVANVSLRGFKEGSKTYILIHMSQIALDYTLAMLP